MDDDDDDGSGICRQHRSTAAESIVCAQFMLKDNNKIIKRREKNYPGNPRRKNPHSR